MSTINCKGKLIDLSYPKVMGIINVTPDSFYDGGKTFGIPQILKQAEKMLTEGATFLDVGGYSSRPNATEISIEEEIKRVLPAVEAIEQHFPNTYISIDTFRSEVAKAAVEAGACIINDISGGSLDIEMYKTVAKLKVPYIAMHLRGNPKTMSSLATYENVKVEVIKELSKILLNGRKEGINDILLDPGFGFAKTPQQSLELLGNLKVCKILEVPIVVGISRKSLIYKTLEIEVEEALNGTTVLNTIALLNGANILRVHDVKEAMECVKLVEAVKQDISTEN